MRRPTRVVAGAGFSTTVLPAASAAAMPVSGDRERIVPGRDDQHAPRAASRRCGCPCGRAAGVCPSVASSRRTSSAWRARCFSASRAGKISTAWASAGGLALLPVDEPRDVVRFLEDAIAQAQEQAAPLGERQRAPRRERGLRGRHRARGLLGVQDAWPTRTDGRRRDRRRRARAPAPGPAGWRSTSDGRAGRRPGPEKPRRIVVPGRPRPRRMAATMKDMEREQPQTRTHPGQRHLLPRAGEPRHRRHGRALAARRMGALRPSRPGRHRGLARRAALLRADLRRARAGST